MPHPRHTPSKILVALLLTFAAGHVDAVGFFALWHVFTAHMTGNTVHLGIDLVQHHPLDAVRAGSPIPALLLGSLLGRCILEYGVRRRWRRAASLILILEAAALSEVIWIGAAHGSDGALWIALLLLSFAMGLQTAALTRLGPLTVHTTFVTGMLNSLAQRLSNILFALVNPQHRRALSWETRPIREAVFLLALWMCYAAGAVGGSAAYLRWHTAALLWVLGILFIGICTDQLTPLSVEEEEEEAKSEIPLAEIRKAG